MELSGVLSPDYSLIEDPFQKRVNKGFDCSYKPSCERDSEPTGAQQAQQAQQAREKIVSIKESLQEIDLTLERNRKRPENPMDLRQESTEEIKSAVVDKASICVQMPRFDFHPPKYPKPQYYSVQGIQQAPQLFQAVVQPNGQVHLVPVQLHPY